MYRIAVLQNQSESLRAGYADVARNFSTQLELDGYEFTPFDGSNVRTLFETVSPHYLATYDAIFISTNAASDEKTRTALARHTQLLDEFLRSGKGIYLGYQKKMSAGLDGASTSMLLPEPYHVQMRNRPESETDSGAGLISISPRSAHSVGAFLLLSSPFEVSEDLIMTHCRENDFKAHVYRAVLVPTNEAAFETVLEDRSYGDVRRLLLVNRSSLMGERIVVSTVAVDWENHRRLLTNIIKYLAEGAPRVALVGPPQANDDGFEFVRSTAKLLRVTNRQYSDLAVPETFARIHDVFVVSANYPQSRVEEFWRTIAGPKPHSIQPAASFRLLYHLGDPMRGCTSLTRYVNYSSIDVVANEALLWIEQQFSGVFWAGGFWNTHDVLLMMDALGLDVTPYLPGVLQDIQPHLRVGGYDAVMGPSCGLLTLLNRLALRHGDTLNAGGFTVQRRAQIASWVLSNLDGQSDVGRQVAARALFGRGSDDVIAALRADRWSESIDALRATVRKELQLSRDRLAAAGEMDLVRVIELTLGVPALESVQLAAIKELKQRQGKSSGMWGSVGRTAQIVTSMLELETTLPALERDAEWEVAVALAIEALRATYSSETRSWGGIIQDTAMSVHALGLYRSRYDPESQELFETIEADARSTERSSSTGRARIDLGELFGRDLERGSRLIELDTELVRRRQEAQTLREGLRRARRKAAVYQVFGGTNALLLLSLLVTLYWSQRAALVSILTSAGSILGLVVGAMVAIPITLLLSPRTPQSETKPEKDTTDD
jgi:hypothetical protein